MLKKRIIPVLMLRDGKLCISKNFSSFQYVGNPFEQVKRLNSWNVDEIIYLDISVKENSITKLRNDDNENYNLDIYELISYVNKNCFIPITWGGNIMSIDKAEKILKTGSDKIYFNSAMCVNPSIIKSIINKFGSQAVVVGIDVKKINNNYTVFYNHGRLAMKTDFESHLKNITKIGPGEVLIHDIDRDGTKVGFNIDLLKIVRNNINFPITILGGAGKYTDFIEAANAGADGIASGNLWHIKDNVDFEIKENLLKANINIRLET